MKIKNKKLYNITKIKNGLLLKEKDLFNILKEKIFEFNNIQRYQLKNYLKTQIK